MWVSGHSECACSLLHILCMFNSSKRCFWVNSEWGKDPWSDLKDWIDLSVSVLTVFLQNMLLEQETPKADLPESLLLCFYIFTFDMSTPAVCIFRHDHSSCSVAPTPVQFHTLSVLLYTRSVGVLFCWFFFRSSIWRNVRERFSGDAGIFNPSGPMAFRSCSLAVKSS